LGICLVGASNCLSCVAETSGHSLSDIVFGLTITLVAQVVQAAQIVGEEVLMKKVNLRPLEVVGWEGLWGSIVLLAIVFPILYFIPGEDHGSQENLYDTFVMIGNSSTLLACVLVYMFSCATFNATGINVSMVLSSVHRMMLDASRTTVIWIFGLCATAVAPGVAFGEHWTEWSPLQLIGFVFVLLGQATYGGLLQWPCFRSDNGDDNVSIREHLTDGPTGGTSLVVVGQDASA
jgi:drug/metabolite transporter (DMT)-like permease